MQSVVSPGGETPRSGAVRIRVQEAEFAWPCAHLGDREGTKASRGTGGQGGPGYSRG